MSTFLGQAQFLASWEGMGVGGSRLHAVKNITPPGKIKSGRCYVSFTAYFSRTLGLNVYFRTTGI